MFIRSFTLLGSAIATNGAAHVCVRSYTLYDRSSLNLSSQQLLHLLLQSIVPLSFSRPSICDAPTSADPLCSRDQALLPRFKAVGRE
jgi:hypothetical protein